MTTPLDHASLFISALHALGGGMIEITALAPKRKPEKQYFHRADLAAERALELNADRYSVFAGVNPRKAFDGHEDAVAAVGALALDLDFKHGADPPATAAMLEAFRIPPSAHIVSGNGAHLYLFLSTLAEPATAKLVAQRLCTATNSDKVFNTNRIMRVPGSVNWKDPPTWCYLTGLWPERRYTLEQVDAALDAMGAPRVKARPDAAPRQPLESLQGVNAEKAWEQIRRFLEGEESDVRGGREALGIIEFGEKNPWSAGQPTRSEADWVVVCALVRAGATDDLIRWVYEKFPVGMMKYVEAGARYLNHTIEEARRRTAEPARVASGVQRMSASTGFTGGAADVRRAQANRRWNAW